jgi:hypothetical protein
MTTIRDLQRQLEELRQACRNDEGEPPIELLTIEIATLRRWLTGMGLSAREALARGLEPPAGLNTHHVSLADIVRGQDEAAEYRRQRLAEGTPTVEPQPSSRFGTWDQDP